MQKWCQSKYVHSGAAPIKGKVWHLKRHSELSLEKANLVGPFFQANVHASTKMSEAPQKSGGAEADPEDGIEIEEEAEMEMEPYHAINLIEARHHVQRLNEALQMMEAKIKGGEIKDVLKGTLQKFKEAICVVMPSMMEANVLDILHSIRDPTCLTLRPQTEEVEGLQEELIPPEEIPSSSSMMGSMTDERTLSDEEKEMIHELFETLETAYDHIGRACGLIGALSKKLKSSRLMTVLKASVRLVIQVNALPDFIQQVTQKVKPTDAPENKTETERIRSTMTPNAGSRYLRKEKPNSPSRLLTTTLAFKILNKFGSRVTQRRLQETYEVQAKQLAVCITGCKYMGGMDRKQIARKRKATDDKPSMSK